MLEPLSPLMAWQARFRVGTSDCQGILQIVKSIRDDPFPCALHLKGLLDIRASFTAHILSLGLNNHMR